MVGGVAAPLLVQAYTSTLVSGSIRPVRVQSCPHSEQFRASGDTKQPRSGLVQCKGERGGATASRKAHSFGSFHPLVLNYPPLKRNYSICRQLWTLNERID
ncbi:hypothetical protein Y032_0304g1938 [Ancylostoma ceylanicum]|uniref:Uncharacterized protein n=1 Tax=Ancylostoma ceylanicum TaxID=53326 RepID=A0A016S3B7_9BILA|nr:hypothetical protein Y032_0304g1938 [Ancylostoma ceylanicum]